MSEEQRSVATRRGDGPLPEPEGSLVRPLWLRCGGKSNWRPQRTPLSKCPQPPWTGLQDLLIFLAVVSFRVFFSIPETNRYCIVTFRGDESDLILKSLLFAEDGNHFVLQSLGKLLRAIDLQLHTDVASIHINLLGWTDDRVEDFVKDFR